jgi:hypothetical protein
MEQEITRNREEKEMDLVLTLYREWREDFEKLSVKDLNGLEALTAFPDTVQNWKDSIFEEPFIQSFTKGSQMAFQKGEIAFGMEKNMGFKNARNDKNDK